MKEDGKRCRYHGGATPRGREWHKRQPIDPNASPTKREGKLRALRLRDKERAARLAAMTPEEREAHEIRRKAAQPGTPADRARARSERGARELLRLLLEKPERSRDAEPAEVVRIRNEIERLEWAARLLREDRGADETPSEGDIYG